jgi:trehalose/maltose hydrolase-like predicted phosphorylase
MDRITTQGFQKLLAAQEQYMDDFWRRSDVRVKDIREERTKRSTVEIQQAIRFNLFHILQAAARAEGAGGRCRRAGEGPDRKGLRGPLILGYRNLLVAVSDLYLSTGW